MRNDHTTSLGERLWFGWAIPVAVYWVALYIVTRTADPMAFPVIFAAAVLVPVLNAWVLVPKFSNWGVAAICGALLPISAIALGFIF